MSNVTINQGTESAVATDLVGTVNYQVIKLDMGTAGTTSPFAGTIPSVTSLGTVLGLGTVSNVGSISAIGTISPVIVSASTLNAGTVDIIKAGTITSVGTVPGVGVVTSLSGGTISLGTVTGNIASHFNDSGNPVKVGGVYNSTFPTYDDTDRGDLQQDSRGNLRITMLAHNSNVAFTGLADNADAVGTTSTAQRLSVVSRNTIFNGTSWDRMPGTTTGVYVLPNGGTLAMINAGTITNSGTTTGVGTISSLGTLTGAGTVGGVGVVTSITNLVSGTIAAVTSVTNLAAGTVTRLAQGSINVTAGTISAGTINTGTINAGTINAATVTAGSIIITNGTISAGTVNDGTVHLDGRPGRNMFSYGTTFGGASSAYGTIVGSAAVGVGTSIWINDLSIINSKGGTVTALVGFGTALNGTSVLAKGDFGPQSGIQKSYSLPVNAGMTNQDLVCYVGAAGTIDVNVSYFISV